MALYVNFKGVLSLFVYERTIWYDLEKLFLLSEYAFWAAGVVFQVPEYVSDI